MAIQGFQTTTAFDTPSGRRPQSFREGILRLVPYGATDKALLTALTNLMKSEATTDPVFHWFTKGIQERRLKLSADLPASAGGDHEAGDIENISVDSSFASAFCLKEGDQLMAEHTGEVMYVNATPTSATTISVIRGFSYAAGTALPVVDYNGDGVNPYLVVIGSAYEEGSLAPDPVAYAGEEVFNQTQISRATVGMTNTAIATATRWGDEWREATREGLEIFSMDMERALLFGQKTTTTRNGKPLRTTRGIIPAIPAARRFSPEDGVVTPDWLDTISTDIFKFGSSEKLVFCGNIAANAISRMVRKTGTANYDLSEKISEYGIGGIRRLTTPNGELVLKPHPLFSLMGGGTNGAGEFTSLANAMLVIDGQYLKYRYLKGRDVTFQRNLQAIGEDSQKAGWLAEYGLELHDPNAFAYITGIKSGDKDGDEA